MTRTKKQIEQEMDRIDREWTKRNQELYRSVNRKRIRAEQIYSKASVDSVKARDAKLEKLEKLYKKAKK